MAPIASKDQARRRFWKHDIKIARDYNKTLEAEEAGCMLTKLSQELAAYHQSNVKPNQLHYSTDLAKDNTKINIKRSEFTWSPCTHFSKKSREIKEMYENLKKCKSNTARILNFNQPQSVSKVYQRRLSQIFVREDDKLNIIKETNSEKTTSSAEFSYDSHNSGKQYCVGNKKFTVVPCTTDPLKPKS